MVAVEGRKGDGSHCCTSPPPAAPPCLPAQKRNPNYLNNRSNLLLSFRLRELKHGFVEPGSGCPTGSSPARINAATPPSHGTSTSSSVVLQPSSMTLWHEDTMAEHLPALVARAPAPSRAVLPPHPDRAGVRPGAGLPAPHQRQLRLRADVWPGTERLEFTAGISLPRDTR